MSDSRYQSVVDAIVERLAALRADGGASAWYTPTVVPCLRPTDELLDISKEAIYLVSPGDEDVEEGASELVRSTAELYITACVRWQGGPGVGPEPGGASRWRVANRIVQDITRVLFADVTLAAGSSALVDNVVTGTLRVDRGRYLPKWVLVELRFSPSWEEPRAGA